MEQNKRKTGAEYEQAAGTYLEASGYEILEYNYRCSFGEIDIIAKEKEYLVFCEVKYRKSLQKGSPLEAVTAAKQKRISRVAGHYVVSRGLTDLPCRFDVIGITGKTGSVQQERIELIKDAFLYVL